MEQEISDGDREARLSSSGTEALIQSAFLQTEQRRIALNPALLDDEKLPEAERVAALHEIFHRNIRRRQMERLAQHLSPVLGATLPPNLLKAVSETGGI
ncbi:MAG: hypothetical protein NTX50_26930 [Candidatus Sumerlaeota bacterium]|nr:hypothetical protein [Candidatus Sumerlaeota bacterium]